MRNNDRGSSAEDPKSNRVVVYINTKISGEPAVIIQKLKERGLAQDNTDCISQALIALWERVIQRDSLEKELELKQQEIALKHELLAEVPQGTRH